MFTCACTCISRFNIVPTYIMCVAVLSQSKIQGIIGGARFKQAIRITLFSSILIYHIRSCILNSSRTWNSVKEIVAPYMYVCVNSIKWMRSDSGSRLVNARFFGAEAWQKSALAWFYSSMAASLVIVSPLFEVQPSSTSLICYFCGWHSTLPIWQYIYH